MGALVIDQGFNGLYVKRGAVFLPMTLAGDSEPAFEGTEFYVDTDAAWFQVTGGAIEESDNVYTKANHGFSTDDLVRLDSKTGGTGLTVGVLYHFHRLDANTGYLCASHQDAVDGTAVNVTLDATAVALSHVGFSRADGSEATPWASMKEGMIGSNTALASAAVQLNLSGATNDRNSCSQLTFNLISNATAAHYLQIRGDADGVWDDNHYTLEPWNANAAANTAGIYNNRPAFVRVINIQIKITGTDGTGHVAFRLFTANVGANDLSPYCLGEGLLIWLTRSGAGRPIGIINSVLSTDGGHPGARGLCEINNCIVFDKGTGCIGIDTDGTITPNVIHNSCTVDCGWYGYGTVIAKNCAGLGGSAAGAGDFIDEAAGTEYCASEDASATGTGARTNQNFTNTFAGGIGAASTGDYTPGSDFSALANVGSTVLTTDARGEPRPFGAADDIGAIEKQT